jgi:hypothetical protein
MGVRAPCSRPVGPSGLAASILHMDRTDFGRIVAFTDGVMAVAFVSPLAAQLMWAATIVLRGPLRGLAARLSG